MTTKRKKIEYDGIEFDSNEELEFYHWVKEAEQYKIISGFKYNCESYPLAPKQTIPVEKKLKTKTTIVDKHLFHEHSYKPDFHLFKGERWGVLEDHGLLSTHSFKNEFVIDIKGSFQLHDGARSFSINQKWVFDRHHIYINKIVPEKFFKLTWVPEKCRFSPKKKELRKKYANIPTLMEKYGNLKP